MIFRFGDDKKYRIKSAKMTNIAFGNIEDYCDIETLNF